MSLDERAAKPQSPVSPTRRRLVRLLRTAILGYLGIVVAMLFFENSLLYGPTKYPGGMWNPPGLTFEDAYFTAPDGVRLYGWHLQEDNPRAVILYAHGNGGNITHRHSILTRLHRLGVSILAFDYRGYGRSDGSPNETGILADARAARAWLAKRAGVAECDIVLLGESLGGGVAVDLAAKDGARGVILESTFTSLPDVAAVHYPWLPVKWLMRNRLNSLAIIANYHGPLLQTHGDADTIVPYENGRQLFAAANEPKQFVTMPGRDHNDDWPDAFFQAIDHFLDTLPK